MKYLTPILYKKARKPKNLLEAFKIDPDGVMSVLSSELLLAEKSLLKAKKGVGIQRIISRIEALLKVKEYLTNKDLQRIFKSAKKFKG